MFLDTRAPVPSGSNDIALDKAELIAIFLEALLYGVEALIFVATVYLLHGAKHTKILLCKFGFVVVMFMLNTIHMGSSLRRILNAFIGTPSDPPPDAAAYLADLAGFLYRFMNILIVIQFIMLDILVVYRCYMIWEKRTVVTFVPSASVLVFLITGIASIHAFATNTSDNVFTGRTRTWVSATLCVTLFTKLVCFATVLAGTILPRPTSSWHSVYLRVNHHATIYKALLIVIESGGLAVLGAIILIPMYLAGQNSQGIMLAAMSPLSGQSFLLIVMATLLGLTPSNSGPSRRRKISGIPNPRVTIPPISVSPVNSPSSRFSTASVFNSKESSPYSVKAPDVDYQASRPFPKVAPRMAEPALAYTDSRYTRGYVYGEPLPLSTRYARGEHSSDAGSRETLPYGDGDSIHISVSSRQEVNVIPERSPSSDSGVFSVGRSSDGVVIVQKEYV